MGENRQVRVRFAPSPTGYLHLGGLRTAFFNYLYARSNGGKIILRIEDTDRSRYVEEALPSLLDSFNWLGIEFDEGPHVGGVHYPYLQSQRLEIYGKYVNELIAKGYAYRCFCSAERLQSMRAEQISSGANPMYDGRCRSIPADESEVRARSEKFVVRMKIPDEGSISFFDGIRGTVTFDTSVIDDQVLLKSDGFPTYHLANVVDDHLMEITDVIRGEEWLTSTPKHIILYRLFGWEAPRFYHIPLLLNKDRSKLSKRQGDVSVEDYRLKGYLPEALLNYTALLGWHPLDDREFMTREELIVSFSLDRVGKAGAVFDIDKLNWLNKQHMNRLSDEEFIELAEAYVPAGFDVASPAARKLFLLYRQRINIFSELTELLQPAVAAPQIRPGSEAYEYLRQSAARKLFDSLLEHLNVIDEADWGEESFSKAMMQSSEETGLKGKHLYMPIRIALTGAQHGPQFGCLVEYLGKQRTIERIIKARVGNSE